MNDKNLFFFQKNSSIYSASFRDKLGVGPTLPNLLLSLCNLKLAIIVFLQQNKNNPREIDHKPIYILIDIICRMFKVHGKDHILYFFYCQAKKQAKCGNLTKQTLG